jgi:hypothetical protein
MQDPEFSNDYGYHDLCFMAESVDNITDDMIDCCVADTSFETAATEETTDTANFDSNFEILEEEFQAMTSQLQTNLSILSAATADASKSSLTMRSSDNNEENSTSSSNNTLTIANDLSATSPDINNKEKTTNSNNYNNHNNKTLLATSGKQLTQCQVVLQELRTECKNKGNAADDSDSEAEFMGLVQRLSLYKIQLEMLRSEHEMHQHQQQQQQ